jgi:hypothetical protein
MPGGARESRLRVNSEDGRGASDEREGKSGMSKKLLHAAFPLLDGFRTCDSHRPPSDSTKGAASAFAARKLPYILVHCPNNE